MPSNSGGTLTFIVDGKSTNVTLVDGKASIPVSGLSAGTHNITVSYSGNGKCAKFTITQLISVSKLNPKLPCLLRLVSRQASYLMFHLLYWVMLEVM